MLVKFEQNRNGPNYTKFLAFWPKKGLFKNHFWPCVDGILEDISKAETIV